MKPIVKLLIAVAALLFLAAAVSSITLHDVLGTEPISLSIGSIALLIIARAFSAVESWALLDPEMHSFTDAQGRSQLWNVFAQLAALGALISLVIAAISVLTKASVFGSFQLAWTTASINLAVLSIVVSGSLAAQSRRESEAG